MTLNENYRMYRNNKIGHYIKLLCIIVFITLVSFTFSAYKSSTTLTADIKVAKFEIAINGVKIESSNKLIENNLRLIPTVSNDSNGVIKAGQQGYFDIEIDPTGTEVSLEYNITIDASKMPSAIKFNSYSVMQNSTEIQNGELPNDNKFSGEINLNETATHKSLDSTDKLTYRIYWKWNGEDYDIDYSEYELDANVTVQQKI